MSVVEALTEEQRALVAAAFNKAIDDVQEAAGISCEDPAGDLLNLVANAFLHYQAHPDATLADVVAHQYAEVDLGEVLGWVTA